MVSPSRTIIMDVPYDDSNSERIVQTNISDSTITLKWKVISDKLFSGWTASICDYPACYPNVPDSSTMLPVDPGTEGFINLYVSPNKIEGIDTLRIYVYAEGKEKKGDTLTWIVNSLLTDINTYGQRTFVTIFPNPVSDYLTINFDSHSSQPTTLLIYNVFGQRMFEKDINTTKLEKIDLTSWAKGAYLLIIKNEKQKQLIKTFVKE